MMKLIKKMMLNCKEATFLITKQQEEGISYKERFNLMLHLMACKFCKLFKKESSFISANIDHMQKSSDKHSSFKMTKSAKSALKETLNKHLDKP